MKEYNIYQGDEFTPMFKILSFDNKIDAEKYLNDTIKESVVYDEYTCFYLEEENQ